MIRTILVALDESERAARGAFDVDLVVVGSHGYDTIDRILGTTAGRGAALSPTSRSVRTLASTLLPRIDHEPGVIGPVFGAF